MTPVHSNRSKQLDEIFHADADLPQNGSQGSTVNLAMIRNHGLCEGIVTPQDHVAAMLSSKREAQLLKSGHDLDPGNDGQLIHTATRRASKCSSGTGSPSS
jgi:hypothetical protein